MQCVCVILLYIVEVYASGNDWDKFMPRGQGFPVLEYVFYTEPMTWNDARSTCWSIGGDLVTIDSEETMDAIELTINELYSSTSIEIFSSNYWVGLTEVLEGTAVWVANCSSLSYHEIFETTWDNSKMCFYVFGTSKRGFRAECNKLYPFMCERQLVEKCTSFVTLTNAEYVSTIAESDACDQICFYDPRCIGTLYVSPLICHAIYKTGTNSTFNGHLSVKAKNCIRVQVNSTQLTQFTDVSNDDLLPDVDCGLDLINAGGSVTSTSVSSKETTSISSIDSQTSSSNGNVDSSTLLSTVTSSPDQTETSTTGDLDGSNANACTCLPQTDNITSEVKSSSGCLDENQSPTITLQSQSGETYICNQLTVTNLTVNEIEEKAEEISQNLTIPSKETSAYLRTLTSAEDKRTSSVVMGTVGIVCVTIPVGLLVLSDIKLLYDTLWTGHNNTKPVTRLAKTKYLRAGKI